MKAWLLWDTYCEELVNISDDPSSAHNAYVVVGSREDAEREALRLSVGRPAPYEFEVICRVEILPTGDSER